MAKIIPIYKAEDPAIFTNYRSTSILPSISNILEKLAYNRFLNLDKNEILYKHQYGLYVWRSPILLMNYTEPMITRNTLYTKLLTQYITLFCCKN